MGGESATLRIFAVLRPGSIRKGARVRSLFSYRFAGWSRSAGLCLVASVLAPRAEAGTTGKISGRVIDKSNQPVIAATVAVVGQPFGAFTTAQGTYDILKVPPGTYDLKISRIGYKALLVHEIQVSADNTTRQDATLEDTKIVAETVVVTAARLPVEINETSSIAKLRAEDIAKLPVQELQDIVNLQAGVVDGHFRGGRAGEVQYQVDGVSINNAFDNSASLHVDRSLLQEVQVISGTFDAEYGQAMSGVVNAVLKEGGEQAEMTLEAYGGGFVFPGNAESRRRVADAVQPFDIRNATATVSGPLHLAKTTYLVNLRHYGFDDYVKAKRLFTPVLTPNPNPGPDEPRFFTTPGDSNESALGFNDEMSGAVKITNRSLPNLKLSYQILFNDIDSRRIAYSYRFNPDGASKQHAVALAHGIDGTYGLGKNTFLDLSFRQNYRHYEDFVYENAYDHRYDAAGPPVGVPSIPGLIVAGVDFTRYEQATNAYLLKGSLVNQANHQHQLKAGFEAQLPEVRFGVPGWIVQVGNGQILRPANNPHDYPTSQTFWPVIGATYVQDQFELPDLTLRVGARLDYFDARSTQPSDLANPANAITGAPLSVPVRTSRKINISPRIGVAYPVTGRAGVHFAYGHFYQFPQIGDIFTNSDYSVLANLQAGSDFRVMGNADVRPEHTVQYEFGYKQALSADFGFEASAFYKDVRDLLGVEFISTYTQAEYARLTNVDFGDVIGITVALDHRKLGPVAASIDYTWQLARGNTSDPRETATRAAAGEDAQPHLAPLNWDQRHTFNASLTFSRPEQYSVSAIVRASSGQPYTPALEGAFGFGLNVNSGRRPAGFLVDLRGERSLNFSRYNTSLFARVFNVFDTRFFNGGVFNTTGSPYYSRSPADDVVLADPTHFYAPRRIEIGFTVGSKL